MLIAFTLSMPNRGSWNGGWSGAGKLFAVVRKMKSAPEHESYYYSFGDGWGASVAVKQVDAHEARRIRKASRGFCGYDWMVDRIVNYGEILNDAQLADRLAAKPTPPASREPGGKK